MNEWTDGYLELQRPSLLINDSYKLCTTSNQSYLNYSYCALIIVYFHFRMKSKLLYYFKVSLKVTKKVCLSHALYIFIFFHSIILNSVIESRKSVCPFKRHFFFIKSDINRNVKTRIPLLLKSCNLNISMQFSNIY